MNKPTPRPHLAPLRNGNDPRAEYRLLVEHRRRLREELADLDVILEGIPWEIKKHGEDLEG
jgi:hypothetical protein